MNLEKYFTKHLLRWHQTTNKRLLPWKEEKDVYKIWLSEIILQQTRAEQGVKYYHRFIKKYPSINLLASAGLDEVYKLWEGLGYYSRCKNLHETAREIVSRHNGKFPETFDLLLKLKGIGPYTAAAISSFAFGLPYAVVDGNVYRLLSRYFGIELPVYSTQGKKAFQLLAQNCLNKMHPAQYNQAIMDFGATICKPDNPLCTQCPFKIKCVAFISGSVSLYPVKKKKIKQKHRWFLFLLFQYKGKIAVQKRTAKDIWANLYEFPNSELSSEKEWKSVTQNTVHIHFPIFKKEYLKNVKFISKPVKQQLSHQIIHARSMVINLSQQPQNFPKHILWKSNSQLHEITFPKIIRNLLLEKEIKLFTTIDKTVA